MCGKLNAVQDPMYVKKYFYLKQIRCSEINVINYNRVTAGLYDICTLITIGVDKFMIILNKSQKSNSDLGVNVFGGLKE